MNEEAHYFDSEGKQLFGVLHQADEDRGTVLILHGFTGNHTGPKYSFVTLARELADEGFNTFRFDFMGSGDSEGQFTHQRIETAVRNAQDALHFLESIDVNTATIGVIGHSLGGTVALEVADTEDAGAVVTWSTVADYRETFSSTEQERLEEQELIRLFGFDYPTEYVEELFELNLPRIASQIDAPLLIAHGEKDYTVSVSQAEDLYAAAEEPKELLSLRQTGHDLTNPDDRQELITRTVDWFQRYL